VWCHNQPFFAAALERQIHLKGAKLVYHCHDRHADRAVRAAFRSFTADAYIFVSEAMRKRWLGLFPWLKNAHVVHNGASEKFFYPLDEKARQETGQENTTAIVMYVGRLDTEKGVHVLMEAMRILQGRQVDALCNVFGSSAFGDGKATFYVRALHRSSPSNVRFFGYRPIKEIADEYRKADIVCCPSVCQDAFPGVPLEAMACKIPVVATSVGGIPEIASEGGVLLVEPDSAPKLADVLQKLIEDKDLRTKIGAEGQASWMRRFTWPPIVAQYHDIIGGL
jgi:spore coat protein SA